MGGKPSNALTSNRPESGGADKDMRKEKSGILEHEKNEFAAAMKEKEEGRPEHPKGKDDEEREGRADKEH
ncbi:MAG TPA: hypothetical protein VK575_02580 [Gemmatimonadaceae bacterium]|nr:hypothetical protein [Gemmatimonadaceae bacterium]